jgi:hypothetical protein
MAYHLPVVTNSELRTFRRCQHEHHLAYGLLYRPVTKAEALRFGSLIDTALDAWWLAQNGERLDAAIEAMRGLAEDEYELVRAGVLMQGYDARWGAEHLAVLAVQPEFRAALVNPETGMPSRVHVLGGKLDGLVRDLRDGLVYIVEHKTSSEDIGLGSPYWKRLTLDSQISVYYAGAKSLGYDVAGCIYDVIGKPTLRPYKATPEESRKYTKKGELYANQREHDETPDEYRARLLEHVAADPDRYYQRGTVVRLQSEELVAAYDTWHLANMIRESEVQQRWPRNPDACMRYNRPCEFFDVCCGTASLDDPTRFRRAENAHEELTGNTTQAA